MATVLDFLQPFFPFAFSILWYVPTIVLYIRYRQKQFAYLQRFPPIDRYQTLDMYAQSGRKPPSTYRSIMKAMYRHQSDAELERLRLEMWRRSRYVPAWGCGFPLLTIGVVALLTVTGLVHLH